MVDLIYDFILNTLIGETTMPNVELLATLLTWSFVILLFLGLIILITTAFKIAFGKTRWRN